MSTDKSTSITLQRQFELLQMEYEYERDSYIAHSQKIALEKKISTGKCWYPIIPKKSFYNSLNQLVVEIERESTDLEINEFEPGKTVCFFNNNSANKPQFFNFTATVSFVDGDRMQIVVPNDNARARVFCAENQGVQLYFDETSYKAMFAALTKVIFAKNNRLAKLRDIIYAGDKPEFSQGYLVSLPWLNGSQQSAVLKTLNARDVAVVHGPPGTGKTTTLVDAIYETLRREEQLLVCAQSNAAVDWIAEKLLERGVSVLRIGNPIRVSDALLSSTYERKFESHPDYSELWTLRKALREMRSNMRKDSKSGLKDKITKIKNRITELEIAIDAAVFSQSRVVVSTLVGSTNKVVSHKYFNTLFIDEAAQALEAACWIAMEKANRVILAGDHCQLPPTIKCIEAQRGGLDYTLMERIVEKHPQAVTFLNTQYRMNADIMQFSSDWFYNGELRAAPEISNRTVLRWDYPIVWYNTDACEFREETNNSTLSRLNKLEAERLMMILEEYINKTGPDKVIEDRVDFGIISPYKSQVDYLRHLLKKNTFLRRFRKQITINSVDGFQGQERDVILISMVRGNDQGKIGFLSDLRRMNVAITRARMKLMILGEVATLSHHPFYRKLFEYVQRTGKVENLEPLDLNQNPNI